MASKLDTVKGRDSLKPRHAPYWDKVSTGCYLGFRKTSADSTGAWLARYRDPDTGKQQLRSLGSFEAAVGAARCDEARKAARVWFEHRGAGGAVMEITVGQACTRFAAKQRNDGKEVAAKDLEVRFKRWMFSNTKLANTPITKLTAGQITDWRNTLINGPALPQDKTKAGTKPRAKSTVNREMAVFKAVLNMALADGHVTTDAPWRGRLNAFKDATGRRDCYLDIEQRRALIAHAPADLAALLRGMSVLPLRPGAVASLVVDNFDKRLGVLTVGKDKHGKDRKLKMPASAIALFAVQCKDKLPAAPLFPRADGTAWNKDSWKYPFKAAVTAAGLPSNATAYALRHSTITDLIALHGLDILTVAKLSGTSLKMIEQHYGHLLQERGADALARLAL